MADYDVIVVGGGVAGSAAALSLAQKGIGVLLIERGDTAGAKNVTGGRLYGHSLERIIPGFADTAPIERVVTRESVTLMTENSAFNLDFQSAMATDATSRSYTVMRAPFDEWLASKAEEAGCDVVSPARVDDLLMENGKVCGVVAGEDKLTADVVVLAEGVNGLLAQKLGMKKELSPKQVAVGAKQVFSLPEKEIDRRFSLNPGEGAARLFAGFPTDGLPGGGFLYTNRETISVGIVITLEELRKTRLKVPDMLDRFANHPAMRPLLEGASLVEYSGHLVPEGGKAMMPELVRDNVLVIGDAAGLCLNVGYTVRGMDLAIASGELAARTILEAKMRNDFSSASLSAYKTYLSESFIGRDLALYGKAPEFIAETTRIYDAYPKMLESLMRDIFTVDGTPARPVRKKVLAELRKIGLLNLAADGWKGMRAI